MSEDKESIKFKSQYPIANLIDRFGDKIDPKALENIDVEAISRILTWNFDYPIGVINEIKYNKEKKRIEFEGEIHDDRVNDLMKVGSLKGVGIGGRIKEVGLICQACGFDKLGDVDNFCGHCGTKVIDPITEIKDFELHNVSVINIPAYSKDSNYSLIETIKKHRCPDCFNEKIEKNRRNGE